MSLEKRPRPSFPPPSPSNERPVIPEGIALDEETAREKGGKKDDGGEGRPLEPGLVGRVRFYGSSLLRNDSGGEEGREERRIKVCTESKTPRHRFYSKERRTALLF